MFPLSGRHLIWATHIITRCISLSGSIVYLEIIFLYRFLITHFFLAAFCVGTLAWAPIQMTVVSLSTWACLWWLWRRQWKKLFWICLQSVCFELRESFGCLITESFKRLMVPLGRKLPTSFPDCPAGNETSQKLLRWTSFSQSRFQRVISRPSTDLHHFKPAQHISRHV